MKHVSCARVAQSLPLYIEGDTASQQAARIAEHLRNCRSCAQHADELSAMREELRLYAPPSFDEDFYNSLRSAVLTEIENPTRRFVPTFSIDNFLSARQLIFSASLIALVIFAAFFAAVLLKRTPQAAREIAQVDQPQRRLTREVSDIQLASEQASARATASVAKKVVGKFAPRAPRHVTLARRAAPPPQIDSVSPSATGTAAPIFSLKHSAETKAPDASFTSSSAPQREATRIEIQTADPNIRIIWLAPAVAGTVKSEP